MTDICALSDLHGYLPEEVPEADILVVAGDISPIDYDRDYERCYKWICNEFTEWVHKQKAEDVIVIGGNHDYAIQYNQHLFKNSKHEAELGWFYLQDNHIISVGGLKFYGLPWVPNLVGWPFYGEREKLIDVYNAVDEDTDVVISHGPYMGKLGEMDGYDYHMGPVKKNVGASQANDMLKRVKPKAFICGHIHEAYGYEYYHDQTHCYNVAIMDENYNPVNKPVVFSL